MTVRHGTVTVGTTAVSLTAGVLDTGNAGGENPTRAIVLTNTGAASVYIGGVGVTTVDAGYELKPAGEIALDLAPGDELFGISTAPGQAVRSLHVQV